MRTVLFLIFLPLFGFSQDLSKDEKTISMGIDEAARINYWAKKGIASVGAINSLKQDVQRYQQEVELKDIVIFNFKNAQVEYQDMVKRLAESNSRLTLDLAQVTRERDDYKEKSRRRGQLIAMGATVLTAITYVWIKG